MKKIENEKAKSTRPPTGIGAIDTLPKELPCTLDDYLKAVSTYVRIQQTLSQSVKKAAQIRLSHALALALKGELSAKIPHGEEIYAGERTVSGALRPTRADLSRLHELDGLRLAVELKPVNLAVGRAIWNRYGDIRTFAVNLHLKFPFAVVGGVLAVPTSEDQSGSISVLEEEYGNYDAQNLIPVASTPPTPPQEVPATAKSSSNRKSTVHLIERAIQRLVRAGGRKVESDAPHLLEAIAVVVYDPDTGTIDPNLPDKSTGLRWDDFIDALAQSYLARFED